MAKDGRPRAVGATDEEPHGAGLPDAEVDARRGTVEGVGFEEGLEDTGGDASPDLDDEALHNALRVAAAEFVHDLPWGLNTRVGEQGISLSGGQRQRLALARAVVGRPAVLVMDDPLSALDVRTEQAVHEALHDALQDVTAIIAVHRPSTVALADRVAFLHDGRIVATGTHEELLASNPAYAAVIGDEPAVLDHGEEVA